MGKAVLLNGGIGTDGLYQANLIYDTNRKAQIVADLTSERDANTLQIAEAIARRDAAKATLDQLAAEYSDLLADFYVCINTAGSDPSKCKAELTAVQAHATKRITAGSDYRAEITIITLLKARALEITYELAAWENLAPASVYVPAIWSVDNVGQDIKTGERGTIEVAGLKQAHSGGWLPHYYRLIAPLGSAGGTGEPYNCALHGRVRAAYAQGTYSAMSNIINVTLAGAHNPRHLIGKLISISGDRGAVTFYGTAPGAPYAMAGFVEPKTITAIPFDYMDCNEKAFQENDWVVVRFAGPAFATPKIIGFADHPRECCAGLSSWRYHGLGLQAANPANMDITLDSGDIYTVTGAGEITGSTRLATVVTPPAILNGNFVGVSAWLYRASNGQTWEIDNRPGYPLGGMARRYCVGDNPNPWVSVASNGLPAQSVLHDIKPDLKRALLTVRETYQIDYATKSKYKLYEASITDTGTPGSVSISIDFVGDYGIGTRETGALIGQLHRLDYNENGSLCWSTPINAMLGGNVNDRETLLLAARYGLAGDIRVIESELINDYVGTSTYSGYTCGNTGAASSNTVIHSQRLIVKINGAELFIDDLMLKKTRSWSCQEQSTANGSYESSVTITHADMDTLSGSLNIPGRNYCGYSGFESPSDKNPPMNPDYIGTNPYHIISGGINIFPEGPVRPGRHRTLDNNCISSEVVTNPEYDRLTVLHPKYLFLQIGAGYAFGVYDERYDGTFKPIDTVELVRLSNNLWAILHKDWPNRIATFGPFFTPSGQVEHDPITLPIGDDYEIIGRIYGTRHPQTDEVSIGTTPRCYF